MLLAAFLFSQTPGQLFSQERIIPGSVKDSVRCAENNSVTYCLYLPSGYSPDKAWAVIYFFDAAARGALPVELYKNIAETRGYILVASDNSKNDLPWDKVFEIARLTMNDAEDNFRIDPARRFTSGFSGGSRVAAHLAINGNIKGVIGCGAGFPVIKPFPDTLPEFFYAGLVGSQDMNYVEMFELEDMLNEYHIKNVLYTGQFRHAWPPEEIFLSAVEWMDLQMMKECIIPEDPEFIKYLWEKQKASGDRSLAEGDILEASRAYGYLVKDFPDIKKTVEIQIKLDSLCQTKNYQKDLKMWKDLREEEKRTMDMLAFNFEKSANSLSFTDSIQRNWIDRVQRLKRQEKKKNRSKALHASRLLSLISYFCYIYGNEFETSDQHEKTIFFYQLASLIYPESQYYLFMYARACAMNNDNGRALKILKTYISLGYDKGYIETDSAFERLIQSRRYHTLFE